MYGNIDFCKYLIEQGADVNIKNKNKETALFYAVKRNAYELCELLIRNNADVNIQNEQEIKEGGNTPLIVSTEMGYY